MLLLQTTNQPTKPTFIQSKVYEQDSYRMKCETVLITEYGKGYFIWIDKNNLQLNPYQYKLSNTTKTTFD